MAASKTCFKCGETKALADFYRHPFMGDGHLGKCKECTKADTRANRAANADYYRAYDMARANLPHRIDKAKLIAARWREQHPERRAAQIAVGNALRAGRLQPMPCWICGGVAEAHHPDYSSQLDVIWLCPAHHKQAHAMAREA